MAEPATAPLWDRFAHWPRLPARVLLALALVMIVLSALAPIRDGDGDHKPPPIAGKPVTEAEARKRDDDLALYDAVTARLAKGENYYVVATEEHRARHFPLRPGAAVRLPTLAFIEAHVGLPGQIAASMLLLLAVCAAWWRRLGEEPGGEKLRLIAMSALFVGASIGTIRYFFVLHELWAGSLLALAFGLHRPDKDKWLGAWLAAAAALAIREHALPFVLLMAAFALWQRRWREGAAWCLLVLAFAAGLALHFHLLSQHLRPDDPAGHSWLTFRGLGGWLSMVVLSSNLRWLPHFIAGPLMMLMVLGWAGWRSSAGAFATLLFLGYGLAFMIAGRVDNWYWGMTIAPTMFVGLAFAPMALAGLWRSALAQPAIAPGARLGQE